MATSMCARLGKLAIVLGFTALAVLNLGAQTLMTVATFTGGNGADPSPLILGSDGNFYGTTFEGGSNISGTVFKVDSAGNLTTLYNFCRPFNCPQGSYPAGPLVQGADGNFYGTTTQGGTGSGTLFQITPAGALTTLHTFCSLASCADGAAPGGALTLGSDGLLYGGTNSGGIHNGGVLFKISPTGAFSVLYSFCALSGCVDGAEPNGGLVQDNDGNFYGTTYAGGTSHIYGTVFRVTPAGSFTTLYSFCSQQNCPDGATPKAGLVLSRDGNFYGTTSAGGANNGGEFFKITSSGGFAGLYSFCLPPGCTDGSHPSGALMQGADGNFYGTTGGGGPLNSGTLFQIIPTGTLTTLYAFCSEPNCTDGSSPTGSLIQTADGSFYGTTDSGAYPGYGTVFHFATFAPAQFVSMTPCRLVDTRSGNPISGGTYATFALPQLAQSQGCGDLSSATVYSLNVTLVPSGGTPVRYLTIWPSGGGQPLVSTMNSFDGRVKANAAIVPAGTNGGVNVYVTDTANVIIDIDGYFATPSQATLKFYPLTPCRVADTRSSSFPPGLGAPHLNGGEARDFPMLNNTTCIPPGLNAAAYSLNLTALAYPLLGDRLGYLEVWPTGDEPQNPVSTLNNPTGTNVANAAIVPVGSNGEITVFPSDDTDLLIDINGYFAASGDGGLSLYPTFPCRVFDSRQVGTGRPFSGTLSPPVNVVATGCGIAASAQAYVFNATVEPSEPLGYLTLWPDGEPRPIVSTLNAIDAWSTSNMAIVPNVNGNIDAYVQGLTQLILDISSYFAP